MTLPASHPPRLLLAGVASGVGKTTIMVGLAGALRRRGLRVAAFKCGPDYLDPSYHERVTGGPCHNLDGWLMGREAVLQTFARASTGCDIALIEGVMGLFDGASPKGEAGSAAEIAKWLDAPVVLCVDAGGMARSIAAVAVGFKSFDPALHLAGLIANRVGSRGHLQLLGEALAGVSGPASSASMALFGGLPKAAAAGFPERYLGLQSARGDMVTDAMLDAWATLAEEWFDLDALLATARAAPPLAWPTATALVDPELGKPVTVCRIGVARDAAFDFYYEDNLARLRAAGAELVFFSPLADARLPAVDGLYFGGGYPEAHAATLAGNSSLRDGIRAFAAVGAPVYAECGGLIYLASAVQTLNGERYPLVDLLPGTVVVRDRLQALGYAEVETQAPSLLGGAGLRFRGHQFRYSEFFPAAVQAPEYLYTVRRRRDAATTAEGYCRGNVLGSYVHAHWASNPLVAVNFVASCRRFRAARAHHV